MINRRQFLKAAAGTLVVSGLSWENLVACTPDTCENLGPALQSVKEWTTLQRQIVPSLSAIQSMSLFTGQRILPGEAPIVRSDLVAGDKKLAADPRSMLFFGHITDAHVVDEESPARVVAAESYLEMIGVRSAFHPQEDLTIQVYDAMIRTMSQISGRSSLQFLLDTGDTIDNANSIELKWALDAAEGRMVDPDSGADDDPVPGAGNDANDIFAASGLPRTIPYYAAVGNHDVLHQGNVPITLREFYNSIVKKYLNCMLILNPTGDESNAVLSPWANPPDPSKLKPGKIIADAGRKACNGRDYIRAFLDYPTDRPVLGFPRHLLHCEYGYYTFKPQSGLPIKVIVMDTTCRLGTALGVIGQEQYEQFLIPELEKAKQEQELVIVVSHHPASGVVNASQFYSEAARVYEKDPLMYKMVQEIVPHVDNSTAYVARGELQDTLLSYPNVFLHIAGHTHSNTINPVGQRGRGYWEVVTSSLMNYPQQGRLFEIVYEGDGVAAIHTCVIDHESAPESLSAHSRQLAYEDHRADIEYGRPLTGSRTDRNAILRFPVPHEIVSKL